MAKMKEAPTSALKLKEVLAQAEAKYNNKDDIFGATLLTNPGYISASRNIMFTSHLRQAVNLVTPHTPYVFTNYENVVGKYSTGYYKAKSDYEVIDKIGKFSDGQNDGHIYLMFIYDKEKDRYEVVEKKIVEDLTEKYGVAYKNDVMDAKKIGDEILKNEILYRTTSYDDDMNYGFGMNAKFMYMNDPDTIEDAVKVSESFAKSMRSKEIETVTINLNDNDILPNIYGDNESYKGFPDIGEYIRDRIVCAKRRIVNSQLLYDLKKSNLRKINYSSDVLALCDGRIVDINIYCNKPMSEIPDNRFNAQLLHYLRLQEKYYRDLYLRTKTIIESGSKYSSDISYYYKRAKNYLDENYKWREEDGSVFNNMVVEFVIEREIGISVGQKITGRYGNKGVVAKIIPDDLMPRLENGEVVHVIFNSLGVINRLNSQQLFEQSITFICNRVRERMSTMTDAKEMEKLLLRILWYFNPEQSDKVKEYLASLSKPEHEVFFYNAIRDGIYVHNRPMWEEEPLFDRLRALYKEFDWIKPYNVYVQKFGRFIKILKPLIVGDMYIMKLKQTSKKQFSARSTGGLSKKGLPEKTNKAKNHQEPYSKTPIRIGDQENINGAIGSDTDIIAQLHLYYRSSVIGRRDLGAALMTKLKQLKDFKYSNNFTNRNIEILNAYFLFLGMKITFLGTQYVVKIDTGRINSYQYGGKFNVCTETEFEEIRREADIRARFSEGGELLVGTPDEIEAHIQAEIEQSRKRDSMLNVIV